jgi:hypothetical protein
MSIDQAATQQDTDLLDAPQAAERWGVSPPGWYRLVKHGKAPGPIAVHPWRWSREQLVEWEKTIPTDEDLERDGWVSVEKSVGWGTFWSLQKAGLVKEGRDYEKKLVRRKRRDSTRIVPVVYARKNVIDDHYNSEHSRRSTSRKRYLSQVETLREGKETLVAPRAAMRLLNVHYKTLLRWSQDDGDGCPYFDDKPLTTVYRNIDGNPVPPGDGAFRCWYLSDLETVKRNRNALRRAVKPLDTDANGREVYSRDETCRRTGIPISTLERKSATDALRLERVEIPVKHDCKRKLARSGPLKTYRIAFTTESVDTYVKKNPNLQQLRGSPGTMTTAEANKALRIKSSYIWCRDGLLDHCGIEKYWTKRGLREGYRPTRKSVEAAKTIIENADGDIYKAAKLLRAQRRERNSQAELRDKTASAQPAEQTTAAEPAAHWISLADAELTSGINRGIISRAVDADEIKHNGQTGKGKRKIDAADFTRWQLERAKRPEKRDNPTVA